MSGGKNMHWIKRWGSNTGLFMASILITLILLEVALRFTPYRNLVAATRFSFPKGYFREDSLRGHDITENYSKSVCTFVDWDVEEKYQVWSNEIGCFDEPYQGEKGYILLVGDSFTHGYAPFKDKWGTVVESVLAHRVLKCGVTGYGTKQELLKAQDVISRVKRQPKLVIVGHCPNDLEDDYNWENRVHPRKAQGGQTFRPAQKPESPDMGSQVSASLLQITKAGLYQRSIIFNLTKDAAMRLVSKVPLAVDLFTKVGLISPYYLQKKPFLDLASIQKHFQNFRELKEMAHNNGAELLVVFIPVKQEVYPFLENYHRIDPENQNKKLRQFFALEGIRYLDLLPQFRLYADVVPRRSLDREKDLYWRYDGHLNIKGNHLTGLLVAKHIVEQNLVEIGDKEKTVRTITQELENFH